jgi:hypothetical protein
VEQGGKIVWRCGKLASLRLNERKTLLALQELGGKASVEKITEKSGLADAAVMRAALTLSTENLVSLY